MNSASRTEKIKLKATFPNNLGIGILLGGLLIPFLAVAQHAGSIVMVLTSGNFLTFQNISAAVGSVVAMGCAMYGGRSLHRQAVALLDKLDDPAAQLKPVPDQS